MKQYLLFEGYRYYPKGGWVDFSEDFDTLEQAKSAIAPDTIDELSWYQIVDAITKQIVEEYP